MCTYLRDTTLEGPSCPVCSLRVEAEILDRLSKGYRSKEIGDARGIITLTVNTHIRNYEKLHVRSRAEPVLRFLGPS